MTKTYAALAGTTALALAGLTFSTPADAQYREKISHDLSKCAAGKGPAVMVTITDVKETKGTIRIQSYRATKQDWLESGRWIYRMEAPATKGTMKFCMPLPAAGHYGIAVRHDVDGDGATDLFGDGGAMSNNPSINIWNMGKPSYKKVGFDVGRGVESISIRMRYR